jgi:hypothetical protein
MLGLAGSPVERDLDVRAASGAGRSLIRRLFETLRRSMTPPGQVI